MYTFCFVRLQTWLSFLCFVSLQTFTDPTTDFSYLEHQFLTFLRLQGETPTIGEASHVADFGAQQKKGGTKGHGNLRYPYG